MELALEAFRLFAVDPVLDGDRHDGGDLLHECDDVSGVGGCRAAPENEDADPPVSCRQRQAARHLPAVLPEERKCRVDRAGFGNRNDRGLLRFPDHRRGSMLGERLRLERNGEVGWFEDDQAELGAQPVVQQQAEVVERDDRVELVAEHVKQLADRPMRGERLRRPQQRVVAREMCRVERHLLRHGSTTSRHLRHAGASSPVGPSTASGKPVRVLLFSTRGLHSDGFSSAFLLIEEVRQQQAHDMS